MELISPKTEREAVGVVKSAIELANNDPTITPGQAVIKAAENHDFTPDLLCRLVEAYNSSASLAHIESSDEIKRADIIPLADPVEVVNHFFPEKEFSPTEKEAANSAPGSYDKSEKIDYMAVSDQQVKSAATEAIEARPRPRMYHVDRGALYQDIHRKKAASYKLAKRLRTEARHNLHKVAECADLLSEYFRKIGHVSFAEVESRALDNFGGSIKPLMDYVYGMAGLEPLGESRGEVKEGSVSFINIGREPYNIIKAAMDYRDSYAVVLNKTADIMNKADHEYAERMKKFGEYTKLAVRGLDLSEAFKTEDKPPAPVLLREIKDPEHEATLASIRQRAVLSDLMANDPVIAAVDPEIAINAFNELAETAPFVMQQPALLRSFLQRRVQQQGGYADPFEVKQLIDMDTALQKREEPASEFQPLLG